jgi:peptide chain release factor 1
VTDHRIGFTSHNLPAIINGDIEPLLEALRLAEVEEQLDV